MILPTKRPQATLAISRMGESCVISEPTGGTENSYGKVEGATFSSVSTEPVVRVYGKGASERSQSRHTGGRLPADSPLLIFRYDTEAREGYRVTYQGDTFEVNAFVRYPTHIEATTTLVN